jgi:hypothetical protein
MSFTEAFIGISFLNGEPSLAPAPYTGDDIRSNKKSDGLLVRPWCAESLLCQQTVAAAPTISLKSAACGLMNGAEVKRYACNLGYSEKNETLTVGPPKRLAGQG